MRCRRYLCLQNLSMELIGYVADWEWLRQEYADPSIREPEHLFRIMDSGSDRIVHPEPPILDRSASSMVDVGDAFVDLVDEGLLADGFALPLRELLVVFCPQVTQLEGLTPPVDLQLGGVFYSVASPRTLRRRLDAVAPKALGALRRLWRDRLRADDDDGSLSHAQAIAYLETWMSVMKHASETGRALLVTLG